MFGLGLFLQAALAGDAQCRDHCDTGSPQENVVARLLVSKAVLERSRVLVSDCADAKGELLSVIGRGAAPVFEIA